MEELFGVFLESNWADCSITIQPLSTGKGKQIFIGDYEECDEFAGSAEAEAELVKYKERLERIFHK